jgi:hypothetical protein
MADDHQPESCPTGIRLNLKFFRFDLLMSSVSHRDMNCNVSRKVGETWDQTLTQLNFNELQLLPSPQIECQHH